MLERFMDIRKEERGEVIRAFWLLFGVLAGHTLLETARDALYLARLPASHLPWLYLAMAGLTLFLSRLRPPRARVLDTRAWLGGWLALAALVTFLFWAFQAHHYAWALYLLYLWAGLVATFTVIQFWLMLGRRFTLAQAKRVYGFIGAGSVLGALTGATVAALLVRVAPTHLLLVAAAGTFMATAMVPLALRRRPVPASTSTEQRPQPLGLGHGIGLIRNHPYLRRIALLIFLAVGVLTAVDYLFKAVVADSVAPERLGTFFATVYTALNAGALVVQVGLVGWLMRLIGVHRALWILPSLLVLGSLGLIFGGGIAAVLLLKGADGGLRHSLHRTSTELLFVPIADSLRNRTKAVIDVVGQRGGQAVASLTIIAALAAGLETEAIALGIGILAGVWLLVAIDIKRYYLDLFRATLREGAIETRVGLRSLDLGALETLFTALNSPDDAEVLGALDLLSHQRRAALIPALILYHPSRQVVLQALDIFVATGRTDALPVCDRLMGHSDPEVRAGVLRARSSLEPVEFRLRTALEDVSPLVRATAVVGLASGKWMDIDTGLGALRDLAGDGEPATAVGIARAIRLCPLRGFSPILLELGQRQETDVRIEVVRAMGALAAPAFVEPLIGQLEHREVRGVARTALIAIGDSALVALEAALGDPEFDSHLRRHIPRTISRFAPQRAANILLAHLRREAEGAVRYKILRGLGRIRADHPEIEMDRSILDPATRETLEAALRLLDWRTTLEHGAEAEPIRATPCHHLLVELLRDKERYATERLFRLLGLLYPLEDMERIYRGLVGEDTTAHASGLELLEFLLEPPLREPILALVEDVPAGVRLARAASAYQAGELSYDGVLVRLLEDGSESLRCLAAFHVGELRLVELRDRLEALRADRKGLVASVIETALQLLSRPSAAELAHAS